MQADRKTLQQELDALVKGYLQRLPGKLESIQRIACTLHAATDTCKALQELRTLAHRLSGSAGTYDCPDVGQAARDYVQLIDAFHECGTNSDSKDLEELEKGLHRLEMAINDAVKTAA